MVATTFSCRECQRVEEPVPCDCLLDDPDYEIRCTDCGWDKGPVEVAPQIWICPGCVEMHRARAA